jgi:hypothetical protein
MKKWHKWFKENKTCLSSSIALILFYLNSIFDVFETVDLSKPSSIGISTILFLVAGRSIGKGFRQVDIEFEIKAKLSDGENEDKKQEDDQTSDKNDTS